MFGDPFEYQKMNCDVNINGVENMKRKMVMLPYHPENLDEQHVGTIQPKTSCVP